MFRTIFCRFSLFKRFSLFSLPTETLKATIVEKKAEQETFRAKIKEYEHNLADSKGYRERQLKEAKDNMAKTKAMSEKSRKEWDKHEKDAEILKLEIEELTKTIAESKEEIDGCENNVKELQQKVSSFLPFSLFSLLKTKLKKNVSLFTVGRFGLIKRIINKGD